MTHPSVTIRRKLEVMRNAVRVLEQQEGLAAEDELNISNVYRMISQIDERHRKALNLSGRAVIPLNRRALAADCLTSAERGALIAKVSGGCDHDPAA